MTFRDLSGNHRGNQGSEGAAAVEEAMTKENDMQAQALNPGWLDCYPSGTVAPLTVGEGAAPLTLEQSWTYPVESSNNVGYYYTWPTPSKLRLTLTEVERLRDAAKDDEDLKAILRKFTPHIEIEVDFP